jgi:SAM-dependent methyltransferase
MRESADTAARSHDLTRVVCAHLRGAAPARILDLGAGTGSNLRYLAPRLPSSQQWLLIDRDPFLLDQAKRRPVAWPAGTEGEVRTSILDLAAFDHPEIFADRDLVTASALLDLVSATWLDELAARCRDAGAAALFALTYNGQSRCSPVEPEDEEIRTLMNRHQRTDKGLGGAAAGPDAIDCAERSFAANGYQVARETSDWTLGPDQRELQQQLFLGWASVAMELEPGRQVAYGHWLSRRLDHLEAGHSRTLVGHEDLAAWLV